MALTKQQLIEACDQLSWVDRYFDKQWMSEDYPLDKVWDLIAALSQEFPSEHLNQ